MQKSHTFARTILALLILGTPVGLSAMNRNGGDDDEKFHGEAYAQAHAAPDYHAQESRVEHSPETQTKLDRRLFATVAEIARTRPASFTPAQQQELDNLLIQGPNINARDENGDTPLIRCFAPGACYNSALITYLLEHGADASIINIEGHSALSYAIDCFIDYNGFTSATIALLIRQGADVNTTTSSHDDTTLLSAAFTQLKLDKITFLLKQGAILTAGELETLERNEIFKEKLGTCPQVQALLLECQKKLLATNKQFLTIIEEIVRTSNFTPEQERLLETLLAQGADINARDSNDLTPLLMSVSLPSPRYNPALTKFLLRHRADARATNGAGQSVLSCGLLSECANRFDIETIELLLKQGADINTKRSLFEKDTLLTLAYLQQDSQKIEFLKKHKATLTEEEYENLNLELDWQDAIDPLPATPEQSRHASSQQATGTPEDTKKNTKDHTACCALQ